MKTTNSQLDRVDTVSIADAAQDESPVSTYNDLDAEDYAEPTPPSTMYHIKDTIWAWASSLETIPWLKWLEAIKQGQLQPISKDRDRILQCFILHSQFRPFVQFRQLGHTIPEKPLEVLGYPHDIRALEKCPVLLASDLKHPEYEKTFTTERIYPPTEHGTVGIVYLGEKEYCYAISELPDQVRERQEKLSRKLEELEEKTTLSSTILSPFSISDRAMFDEDEEVKRLIQQLAQDYYDHHASRLPSPRSVFANGRATMPSCLPFQAAIASIHAASSNPALWVKSDDQAPYFRYEKRSGTSMIEYKTGRKSEVFNSETTASLWKQLTQLSDSSNDVLLALFAHFTRLSGGEDTIWFFASQYLDDRGLERITKEKEHPPKYRTDVDHRRSAGHRQERIAEVGDHLSLLENFWITINQTIDEPGTGKKKRKQVLLKREGRLFMIEERITQKDLHGDSSSELEVAWKIRPGSWLRPFLEAPNRQVANLFQKSLQYDPYRQQWEKRLSRYFMIFGHIETHGGGGKFNREIKKLLQEVSLPTEDSDHPKRIRASFERAMNQLKSDHIISEWHYTENISLPARNWLPTWLGQQITIYIAPTNRLKASG